MNQGQTTKPGLLTADSLSSSFTREVMAACGASRVAVMVHLGVITSGREKLGWNWPGAVC